MNRGALIGGAVLVALLVGFAGLFIVMNAGPTMPDTSKNVSGEEPKSLRIGFPSAEPSARTPLGSPDLEDVPEGDVPDENGRTKRVDIRSRPKSEQLGQERWDELRASAGNRKQAKAMGVVTEFIGGKTDEDAELVREVFVHMFDTSLAIREDMQGGVITSADGRAELGELRSNTIRELTTVLGPTDYAILQRELRTADAAVF